MRYGRGKHAARLARLAKVEDTQLACVARTREIEERQEGVEGARRRTEASAANALTQIRSLFLQVEQHKHGLAGLLLAVRKTACQPVTDAVVARLVLTHAVHGTTSLGIGQHLQAVLEARAVVGGRRVVVRFSVVGVTANVGRWKRACGVYTSREEKWRARAGAVPRALPSLGTPRSHHGAAATRSGRVFVAGGNGQLSSCERLDEAAGAWVQHPVDMPTPRGACAACAVGDTFVVVGGEDVEGGLLDVVEALDTLEGTWHILPPLPVKVGGCGVVGCLGRVVVLGGYDGASSLSCAWMLDLGMGLDSDPATPLQWTRLPDMRSECHVPGAAGGDGRVFVCGGFDDSAYTHTCEMLDLRRGGDAGEAGEESVPLAWERLPPLPTGLHAPGCCYGGGNVFVVGGWGGVYLASVFALCVQDRTWALVGEISGARAGCACVCVGRRVMVLGGGGSGLAGVSICEFLEF